MIRVSTKRQKNLLISLVLAMMFVFCTASVTYAGTSEAALSSLKSDVKDKVGGNKYAYAGGGSTTGSALLTPASDTGDRDTINESEFEKLSSSEQQKFLSDIVDASQEVADRKSTDEVDDSTVQIWWKQLQEKSGVGSKFMTVLLQDTKPDFVAARAIWKPFSGPVGVALGVLSLVIMGTIGIVMGCDIAYIVLPPFRALVPEESGSSGKKSFRSYLVSYQAISAVKESESGNSGNGEQKQALGIYFRHRVVMLIALGICLMYLVNGQIFTLVGWILDLVSGFLKF